MSTLNIILAGTPDFAAQHLQALLDSEHHVIAVYTQPDKPAGRGKKLQASPVKQLAEKHQIPVYQPKSLRKEEAQAELKALNADVMVVVAYGLILLMKEGYPCLFYGDYYGIKGEKSPHTRIIDILLDARRKYAYGDQIEYFDHPSTIGFIRTGDEEHNGSGLVFLMSNDEAGSKIMSLGEKHKCEVWHEITGSISEEITLDEEGNGEFSVESRNLAVWVKKD